MIVTVTLPDDVGAALLAEASASGRDAAAMVAEIIADRFATSRGGDAPAASAGDAADPGTAWWDALPEPDREDEVARTRQSLAEAKAGKLTSLPTLIAQVRARHGFPADWPASADSSDA